MHKAAWRALSAITMAALLPIGAAAGAASAPGAAPADARGWLARIHAAAKQRNYQGTMVFSANGILSSSRVAHFCVGDQSFERVEALDGRQQRIYRHNDTVHTLWPQARVAVLETRSPISTLPSATQAVEPRALEQYQVHAEGSDRIAGREAQVLLLQPRDDLRYAQRLWADKATGLMLRADVIGQNRSVLESSAFSEVEIGIRAQPESSAQLLKKLDGYRVLRPQQQATQLEAEGWTMERNVPGFQLAGCVKRPLPSTAAGAEQVLQVVFSDGLTHVSVFIEPYDERSSSANLTGQIGATATLRQRRGDHSITVLGDAPAATLKLFADALQRSPSGAQSARFPSADSNVKRP